MKNKFLVVLMLIFVSIACVAKVEAGVLDNIIEQGNNFGGGSGGAIGTKLKRFINGDIKEIISKIGNLIFAIVTVVLGVKYIWSSAEGKSQVMESLPGFVLAVIFFYLGGSLIDWLTDTTKGIKGAENWKSITGYIMWIVNTLVRYASFGGILFMGLKYMFASSEGRAQIKTNLSGLLIGIMFVFLASTVVDYIIDVTQSVL